MTKDSTTKNVTTSADFPLIGSVPINTAFKSNIAEALDKYAKDKGLNYPQDVIRLACSMFLSKAGYLQNNS